MKKSYSIMCNLEIHHHFKLYFHKVDQHTGDKWLINGTKQHEDNQLQSPELPWKYPARESKHDIKESEGKTFNIQSNIQR